MRTVIVIVALCILAGCGGEKAAPAGPVNEYRLEGTVVRLDARNNTAVIRHEKIEGWMEAMTMEFPVPAREEFRKLQPGMRIRARVQHRPSDFEYWLDRIEAVPEGKPSAPAGQKR